DVRVVIDDLNHRGVTDVPYTPFKQLARDAWYAESSRKRQEHFDLAREAEQIIGRDVSWIGGSMRSHGQSPSILSYAKVDGKKTAVVTMLLSKGDGTYKAVTSLTSDTV